ncbi:conserved hypothetical protein [Vibrio chagasii]|nr:conserved hypothetical protein [Vibrio chagasii]CAH6960258.1 conserved hypothetical protein [Vibrio chagasii]
MLKMLMIFTGMVLIGCDQRTDFDACVEYYTEQVRSDDGVSLDAKQSVTEYYINEQCRLNK